MHSFADHVAFFLIEEAEILELEVKTKNTFGEQYKKCEQVTPGRKEKFHKKIHLDSTITGGDMPSQARFLWCSRKDGRESKTRLYCGTCGAGFCSKNSGQKCWALHVQNDGPPECGYKRKDFSI